jgi:hypothetical protein
LDKECGVLDSATMVQEFEIPIARARRSIPEAQQLKNGDQLLFCASLAANRQYIVEQQKAARTDSTS